MKRAFISLLLSLACAGTLLGAAPHFVVDDDAYVQQVATEAGKLLHAHKLLATDALRKQLRNKEAAVALAPVAHQKLEAPDLYERLRQSTLAVGVYYKCPDCGGWHFNGSTGFAINDAGVISTCCHVVAAVDSEIKESYVVAADSTGHVFPVKSVIAADTESDTCLLKTDATGLVPLPLRSGVRPGERVYCLSHPGGYYFMFTQGMVARLNRRQNDIYDEHGHTNGLLTRPIEFLNVTAEFAPGSSGAAIVDEAGNAVGQVASIADAGEPQENSPTNSPAWPSVPVRFCTATEELLKLTAAPVAHTQHPTSHVAKAASAKPEGRVGAKSGR